MEKTLNKKFWIMLAIGITLFLVTIFVYLWGSSLNIKTEVYTEWLQFAVSLLAGISIISLGKSIGTGIRQSRTWLMVGLSFILWSLGMFVWAVIETLTNNEPGFPGYQDIGFMLMYLLIIVAFFFQLRAYKNIIKPTLGLFAIVLVVVAAYIGLNWVELTSSTGLALAVQIYYAIGGIIVVVGSILMFNLTKSVKISHAWMLLAISIFLITFNNSLYNLLENLGLYNLGQWKLIDLMTIAGFLVSWIGANRLKDSFS